MPLSIACFCHFSCLAIEADPNKMLFAKKLKAKCSLKRHSSLSREYLCISCLVLTSTLANYWFINAWLFTMQHLIGTIKMVQKSHGSGAEAGSFLGTI